MIRCVLITLGLLFVFAGSGCKLNEVPGPEQTSSAINFERNFGTTANNEAAHKVLQLSNGDYVIFGYGDEEIIKLSKTGQKIRALASSRWVEGGFKTSDDKIIFCGFDTPSTGSWVGIVTQLDSNLMVEKEVKTPATTTFPVFNWGFDVKPASDGTLKVMGINNNIPFVATMSSNLSAPPSVLKTFPDYSIPFRTLFVDQSNFQWFSAPKSSQNYLISYTTTQDVQLPMLAFRIIGSQNGELILVGKASSTEFPHILVRKFGNFIVDRSVGTRKGSFSDIVEVSDGYVLVGTVNLGKNGGSDLLLVKVSKDFSNVIWERDFGGSKDDSGNGITATTDGGFVAVGGTSSFGTSGDFYVIKTNSKGEIKR